jgi:hypothetical protein
MRFGALDTIDTKTQPEPSGRYSFAVLMLLAFGMPPILHGFGAPNPANLRLAYLVDAQGCVWRLRTIRTLPVCKQGNQADRPMVRLGVVMESNYRVKCKLVADQWLGQQSSSHTIRSFSASEFGCG